MRYVCSLSNPGVPGEPKELITSDSALVEKFIKAEDRPGRGVYECINPLTPGANRRNLETVAVLQFIYFDLDLQNIESSREEVIDRLRQLPISCRHRDQGPAAARDAGIRVRGCGVEAPSGEAGRRPGAGTSGRTNTRRWYSQHKERQ